MVLYRQEQDVRSNHRGVKAMKITDDTIRIYLASQIITLGSSVHVTGRDVAQAIDCDYVLTDKEYKNVLARCCKAVDEARNAALWVIWGQ